jgi:hypothetical protein
MDVVKIIINNVFIAVLFGVYRSMYSERPFNGHMEVWGRKRKEFAVSWEGYKKYLCA